ncbi:peptide/nickel transport system substrate-binding protein/oligopeptide transport system substrate-binding protein [Asanoa ferruginea]|uniref:Peptide/nickel transport system substrate-binding protein/oligopeptide transport system substrate-binding protein n=1 Tax=Asanoa ferruginea TaxID=53367 RepID=A0A3D9ZEC6_9ACTN|nr:ABC transporter substrate-binding protein [Asanoa ferruginea]REF95219.1 peptide/nickel transport system substrate-binding protein/oligopeptide transport system substrate-binding protein [Asanoa ferruginea]GIF53480.1 putative peptide ABC transporter DppA [Asanoa ferruginea]
MQVRRLIARAVVPLVATAGLVACNSGDSAKVDPAGVVSIQIAEPQHLLPTNTNDASGVQVITALFEPLVNYDAEFKPVPDAAESIESKDHKVWTIKLKPGYTFHNGEKVTVDNYIDAWNYGAYGPNGQNNGYFFSRIDGYADTQSEKDPDGDGPEKAPAPKAKTMSGLKKIDDLTMQVTLSEPFTEFETILGYTAFVPLPKAAFSSPGVINEDYESAPIGQGPFQMNGKWEHDAKVEVAKYDAFPGTKPKVGGVEFRIYLQPSAAYADVLSDNLDVIPQIPTESIATASDDLGDRFERSSASQFQFLAFPTYDPEFKSPEVRKAISMAIDRDEIVRSVFKGSQQSARSFVSPVVAGYRENTCGEACEYNPGKAKTLYTSNNGPAKLELSYNADGPHKDWIDATCNQLQANLGVECTTVPEAKIADLLTKVQKHDKVGIFRLGWTMDYPSMESYLGPLYATTGSSNYYGYSNPAFDKLVKEGSAAATPEESIKKYQDAEDILAKDLPVIPLRFAQNNYGYSTRVRNVVVNLFSQIDLNQIEVLS